MTYEVYFGLWLNRNRATNRTAFSTTLGVLWAFKLPPAIFTDLADFEPEAEAARQQYQSRQSGRASVLAALAELEKEQQQEEHGRHCRPQEHPRED